MTTHNKPIQPTVSLLNGDAALDKWRCSNSIDASWLEGSPIGSHPFAPWINLASKHRDGEHVVHRLSKGPRGSTDPDNPILSDPFGTYLSVAKWIEGLARNRPLVLALRQCQSYGRDSLNLLLFVTRFLSDTEVAILLLSEGSSGTIAWEATIELLRAEIGIFPPGRGTGFCQQIPEAQESKISVQEAMTMCISGAVHAGAKYLSTALLEQTDSQAWQMLAMVGLWFQDEAVVESAVAKVLASDTATRSKARALRTWLLSIRRLESLEQLSKASKLVSRFAADVPHSWQELDNALLAAADNPTKHKEILDVLLGRRNIDIAPSCLATALIWRSSAAYFDNDFELVVELLEPAIELLAGMGDYVRTQHVRTRYGIILSALGRFHEAQYQLALASREAAALGNFDLAAICAAECTTVSFALGRVEDPLGDVFSLRGWRTDLMWQSRSGLYLASILLARGALAKGRFQEAKETIEELLSPTTTASDGSMPSIRVICEANLLYGDIVEATGSDARRWFSAGFHWANKAPQEDQPILRARAWAKLNANSAIRKGEAAR